MKNLLLLSVFIFIAQSTFAQGTIQVNETPAVAALMDQFEQKNRKTTTVDGWRIQLLASSDRAKVEAAKRKFQTLYPNIFVDWTHSKPYYKLRAGAFASKLDALRMLHIMKADYPTAYPAKDNTIRPRDLLY